MICKDMSAPSSGPKIIRTRNRVHQLHVGFLFFWFSALKMEVQLSRSACSFTVYTALHRRRWQHSHSSTLWFYDNNGESFVLLE
jgi:hypothetical protein